MRPLKRHALFTLLLMITLVVSACNQNDGKNSDTEAQTSSEVVTESPSEASTEATSEAEAVVYPETNITKDDVIYFIMVDRFSDSNPSENLPDVDKDDLRAFQGGDLQGIIDQLDYIKSTGATAIWLTPIMENGPKGYHGYWIYDFYQVDPHFGDLETFKTLVKKAHEMDIKVVLDYIVNHTGYDSPWLTDADKADWFNPDKTISNWKDKEEVENGWLAGLPDLDQSNPEVEAYFIENALWWIEETGIDGFRLDTMRHVSHDFWQKFSSAIKEKYPTFFLLGEVWDMNSKTLETYHQSGIDSITNYSLFNGIENGFNLNPNMASLVNALKKESAFTHPELNAIFIDNHDNARFMSLNPKLSAEYTKQALTFVYSYPAIPVIYYGTELGMDGAFDPENRKFMAWDTIEGNDMLAFTQMLSDIRETYMDDFKLIYNDQASIAYEISKGDAKMLIVMNVDPKEKNVTFEYEAASLIDYELGTPSSSHASGLFNEIMPPASIKFYIVE